MHRLTAILNKQPIVPFIRECDFAVRKPWVMPERRLLDYLLIYVQEGACCFRVEGTDYEFRKGEFCLIQPGDLNELRGLTDTVTPFAHFDVFFNADRESSFPTRAGQTDLTAYRHLLQPRLDEVSPIRLPVRLEPSRPASFRDAFLQVVEYWQYHDPVMQLKAQSLMLELIISLLEDGLPVKEAQRTPPQSLNWITSYFSVNLTEPLSIADMAGRANLSPSRFSGLFKRLYGMTPHQYLLDMRVNHARELLQQKGLSQEQIAAYCGFADIHHFSKAFKKRTGRPPGYFRPD